VIIRVRVCSNGQVLRLVPAPEPLTDRKSGVVHVVSVSGGKDSLATLLIAIARFGKARIRAIFCDTGHEHPLVYTYLDYLEQRLGLKIERLRANFDEDIARKRMFIARDQRTTREYTYGPKVDKHGRPVWARNKDGSYVMEDIVDENGNTTGQRPVQAIGYDAGRKLRWSNKAKRAALAILHPTGNPYLDLCLWKGRFPSRRAQFCTEHLKRNLAVEFQMNLVDEGHTVVSWQGVRRDESRARADAKKFESIGPRMHIYRPIVEWTAQATVDFATAHDVKSNPLYTLGMGRVGCMPCINVGKDELREIALRFPDEVARVVQWEQMVGQASKRGFSTFFADGHKAKDRREVWADLNIMTRIEWAKTTRGGRQYDLLGAAIEEDVASSCSSSYGLCG
jgi:3'-phosphoadenosine 5'-phosphosulfate sulfotransferase (PAPS reductase)/FAD synthetase